jgi:hypothetical protein
MTLDELANRFDDLVAVLERIAAALEQILLEAEEKPA